MKTEIVNWLLLSLILTMGLIGLIGPVFLTIKYESLWFLLFYGPAVAYWIIVTGLGKK